MISVRKLKLVPSYLYGSYGKPASRRLRKLSTYIKNKKVIHSRKRFRQFDEALYQEEKAELKKKGIVVLKDILSETEKQALVEVALKMAEENPVGGESNKDFWQRPILSLELDNENELIKFASQEAVLNVVSDYLGDYPLLNSVEIIRSINTGSQEWTKSQLWHLDHDDTRMVKFFIYLSDVTDGSQGPFQFYDAPTTKKMRLRYYPVHKRDEIVLDACARQEPEAVLGTKGESFLIDTHACLHCGSRIAGNKPRLVYVATYTSSYRLVPTPQKIFCRNDTAPKTKALLQPIDI